MGILDEASWSTKLLTRAVTAFDKVGSKARWTKNIKPFLIGSRSMASDAMKARAERKGAGAASKLGFTRRIAGMGGSALGGMGRGAMTAGNFVADHPKGFMIGAAATGFAAARPARGGVRAIGGSIFGSMDFAQRGPVDDALMMQHQQAMSSSYKYQAQEGGYVPGQVQGPSGDIVFGLYNMRA